VFWQSDTSATVFYLCDEAIEERTIQVKDTLWFFGFCSDDTNEYIIPSDSITHSPAEYKNVSRIFAVSDIHGEYDHFLNILINGKVMDRSGHWIWGHGHLVILGDVFDRGERVTECLWLIRRLEAEAEKHGGKVHFLLGNHEVMVMRGDRRYVNDKYTDGIVKKTRIKYEDLYGADMETGRWLRSKNTVIRINDIVFVHGGLSPGVLDRGLDMEMISKNVRKSIDLSSARLAFDEESRFLLGSKGPLWYRGYHYEMEDKYPMISSAGLNSILDFFGGDVVVVGHSNIDSVMGFWNNRVIGIDVLVEDLGTLEALLWEGGRFYRVKGDGRLHPIE
jgi:hypothetical protein